MLAGADRGVWASTLRARQGVLSLDDGGVDGAVCC